MNEKEFDVKLAQYKERRVQEPFIARLILTLESLGWSGNDDDFEDKIDRQDVFKYAYRHPLYPTITVHFDDFHWKIVNNFDNSEGDFVHDFKPLPYDMNDYSLADKSFLNFMSLFYDDLFVFDKNLNTYDNPLKEVE